MASFVRTCRRASEASPCPASENPYALKLENVLHCYTVEYQRLTVLHSLLHAVTLRLKYHKNLITKHLLCYINDNDFINDNGAVLGDFALREQVCIKMPLRSALPNSYSTENSEEP